MHSNRTLKALKFATAAAALGVALAGCGGSDDDDKVRPATEEVPASASESSAGFVAYLRRLVGSGETGAEPVDISGVTAPVSDTGEPEPLD